MFPGVVFLILPLCPEVEELLHRQQLPALQHPVDVLFALGIGLRAGQRTGVAFKPFGELLADGSEKSLNRFVPGLEGQRPPHLLDADAFIEALGFRVESKVDLSLRAFLAGHGLAGVVFSVIDMKHFGDTARRAIYHFDQRLFQRVAVGIDAGHIANNAPAPHIQPGH